MINFKLKNNDVFLDATRNLAVAKDGELVKQNILISLNLLNGKFYYDSERGIDWYQFMQNTSPSIVAIFLTDYLYSIPGVAKVYSIAPKIDQNRKMIVNGVLEDNFENLIQLAQLAD